MRKNKGLIIGIIIFMIPIVIIRLAPDSLTGGDERFSRIDWINSLFDKWLYIAGETIETINPLIIVIFFLLFILLRYLWKLWRMK